MMKQEQIDQWKKTRHETKERRLSQICKVYKLKIDKSHLSLDKLDHLNKLFLEAKWLYNDILSQESIFNYNTKSKQVVVLNKDREKEVRDLDILSSQMRQGIKDRLYDSIKALSRKKKKGSKIGRLKFKSRINSIPLQQYDCTYRIRPHKKYIRIQGFKRDLKILGFNQIPEEAEPTSAMLIRRQNDYYINITCFLPKENKVFKEKSIGIDFGIKDSLTLSNGEKFKVNIGESKRIKQLQRELSKKVKGSNNRYKIRTNLEKSYYKIVCQKKEARNKIVSYITNTFETVCIQDESIKEWHSGWFGKQVQHSALGGIMSDLKRKILSSKRRSK